MLLVPFYYEVIDDTRTTRLSISLPININTDDDRSNSNSWEEGLEELNRFKEEYTVKV